MGNILMRVAITSEEQKQLRKLAIDRDTTPAKLLAALIRERLEKEER